MMFGDGFHEDQNIVEVHTYDAFSNQILEDVIHHHLEGGQGHVIFDLLLPTSTVGNFLPQCHL